MVAGGPALPFGNVCFTVGGGKMKETRGRTRPERDERTKKTLTTRGARPPVVLVSCSTSATLGEFSFCCFSGSCSRGGVCTTPSRSNSLSFESQSSCRFPPGRKSPLSPSSLSDLFRGRAPHILHSFRRVPLSPFLAAVKSKNDGETRE